MERKFRLTAIAAIDNNHILITLTVIRPQMPDASSIVQPKFKTEEERIGYRMGQSMLKGMIIMGSAPPTRSPVPMGIPIVLTNEEYAEIGSPGINQLIVFDMLMRVENASL